MVTQAIRHYLTLVGLFISHPAAFVIVAAYAVFWFIFQPDTFDWHAIATLAVWFMTLLIQRTEHRDTQAIHAKLDELLRSQKEASNDLIKVDQEEPEDIEQLREAPINTRR